MATSTHVLLNGIFMQVPFLLKIITCETLCFIAIAVEMMVYIFSLPLLLPPSLSTISSLPSSTLLFLSSLGDCINQVRTIASLYCNFHRLLRSCDGIQDLPIISSGFKFKDFFWAVSTVMSRQNKIVINKEKKTLAPALIPLWDLCNHSHGQVSSL